MELANIDDNLVINQNKQPLPNATAVLVLGIIAIPSCICYGIPAIVLGIIALAISQKSVQLYKENPELYSGYENLKAGRITGIIGLCLGASFFVFMIIYILIIGSFITAGNLFDKF
jgi:hypothetical protein